MTDCPVCMSDQIERVLKWDEYSILRCCSCHLLFSDPIPSLDKLNAYYQGFMFRKPNDRIIQRLTGKKTDELKRLFDLGSEGFRGGTKTFLDFGGGTGVAYHAAVGLGLDAYYYDLDEDSIEFVSNKFGLKEEKLLRNPAVSGMTFDYIFSDNVIEHTPDPLGFVRQLYAMLNDGGVLVLKTPHACNAEVWFNPVLLVKEYISKALKYNAFSVVARSCVRGFWHCDPPRHLYSFSAGSLRQMAVKLGVLKGACEITYYPAPMFSNTITEHLFLSCNRPQGTKGILLRILASPMVLVEVVLQSGARVLESCGLISPGGIIVRLTKNDAVRSNV